MTMFVFVFVYIKKYRLQTEKCKLNYCDYFLHFVILLVLKVYISLVMQKIMINCTPRNQWYRWNFPVVMIKCDIGITADRIKEARKYLILVHAFAECNTTSAAYEQGKLSALKHSEKFKATSEEVLLFFRKNRTLDTIC